MKEWPPDQNSQKIVKTIKIKESINNRYQKDKRKKYLKKRISLWSRVASGQEEDWRILEAD